MPNPYTVDNDAPDEYSIWHLGECHAVCVPRYILLAILDNANQNESLREAIREQIDSELTILQENLSGKAICT